MEETKLLILELLLQMKKYDSKLSYYQFDRKFCNKSKHELLTYLRSSIEDLLEQGLINDEKLEKDYKYEISEKGIEFLNSQN